MTPRMPPVSRGLLRFVFLLCLAAVPDRLSAQEEVAPVLHGTLFLAEAPADTGMVVLHWVTPEESGVVDSTSVDAEGGFSLELPHLPIPNSSEVFFATSRYDGVLYTGGYITDPIQLDSVYEVRTYPAQATPAGGVIFPVAQREVWIDPQLIAPSQSGSGEESADQIASWRVTDVLDIQNRTDVTFRPEGADGRVWSYPLPPTAKNLEVIQVGPIDGPSHFEGTTLVATNTVVPGDNYYIVQYDLESIEFDLPLPGSSELVRMFMREPTPDVHVQGLAAQGPTDQIEAGSIFDVWAGQNLSDQTIEVRPGGEGGVPPVVWLAGALSLLLVAIGSWVIRRDSGRGATGRERQRKDILVEVATLDEAYARLEDPTEKEQARYRKRRARLARELSRAGESGGVRVGS